MPFLYCILGWGDVTPLMVSGVDIRGGMVIFEVVWCDRLRRGCGFLVRLWGFFVSLRFLLLLGRWYLVDVEWCPRVSVYMRGLGRSCRIWSQSLSRLR